MPRVAKLAFLRSAGTFAVLAWWGLACAHPQHEPGPRVVPAEGERAPVPADSAEADSTTHLDWPLHGRVSSGFGHQRSRHQHQGIDIRNRPGTPIRAAAGGRVRYSGTMRGYGKVVILDHGDGLETRYAHNRRNLVRQGQSVQRGQTIAELGATGNATAPHVHFEVRFRGEPRDPVSHLPPLHPAAR